MRDKMNVKKHQFRNPRVIFSAPKQSAGTERALSTLLRRKGNYALAERRKGRSYNAKKKCLKEVKRNRSVQSGVRGVHYNCGDCKWIKVDIEEPQRSQDVAKVEARERKVRRSGDGKPLACVEGRQSNRGLFTLLPAWVPCRAIMSSFLPPAVASEHPSFLNLREQDVSGWRARWGCWIRRRD